MREGSLDRNVRDAEDRTFQRVSAFSRLNPLYSGAIDTESSSFHSLQGHNRLNVFTHTQKKGVPATNVSQQKFSRGSGFWGKKEVVFGGTTGQQMFVNGLEKQLKSPIRYNESFCYSWRNLNSSFFFHVDSL